MALTDEITHEGVQTTHVSLGSISNIYSVIDLSDVLQQQEFEGRATWGATFGDYAVRIS